MPIRFRCTHCQQLMGIARRKAGSVVRCPSCQRGVAVPDMDDEPSPPPSPVPHAAFAPVPPAEASTPPPANPATPRSDLFDRDDFDALLRGSISTDQPHTVGTSGRPAAASPPPPPPLGSDGAAGAGAGSLGVGSAGGPRLGRAPGIALSPKVVTMLSVVVILLLAAAFALGLVIGRSTG